MLDDGLRVQCSVPGTPGISAALIRLVRMGTVVTAYDDSLLRTVKTLGLPEGAELAPFSDLVGRFSRMWGVDGHPQASSGQRQATVSRILSRLDPGSFLSASAPYPGSAEKLVDVIRELEHAGLDAEALLELADVLESRLARRLRDVAAVMQAHSAALAAMNRETSLTRITRCIDQAKPLATPIRHVVCLTHGEHAPLFDRFLAWLVESGVAVDRIDEPAAPGLFWSSHARGNAEAMTGGVLGLFQDSTPALPFESRIVRAPDAMAECEWAVRHCLRLRQEGFADHEIAVLARDSETYSPLLLATASRLGVPLSASWSQPLLANGMAETVLATLRTLAGNDVRALGRVAKSSLLSAPGSSITPLWEILKQCYMKGGDQWTELAARSADLAEWPWVSAVCQWREEALSIPAGLTIWSNRLRLLGAALDAHRSPRTDERDQRAQNLMQRSLLDVASTHPNDDQLALPQFVRLAQEIWTAQRVTVDDRKGGVWVGSSAHTLPPVRALMVLGMVEGVMPRRRSQEPVLGDELRTAINQMVGSSALATSYDRASEERDEFVRVCATASDRMVFTFPESDGEAQSTPSYFLRRIAASVGKTVDQMVEIVPRTSLYPAVDDCLARQDMDMARSVANPVYRVPELDLTDFRLKDEMRLDPDQGVELRRLGDFSDCPFRSAVRHRLGLYSAHPSTPLYRLTDLPTRAGLATAPTEHEAAARLYHALKQKLESLYSELEPWEVQLLKSAGERLIEAWVSREFAARKLWPRSDFEFDGFPVHALRLGEGGTRGELDLGNRQTVPILTDLFPVYQVGPFLVARSVEVSMSDPAASSGSDDEEETGYQGSAKWLKHGLLLGFLAKSGTSVALEIETLGTKRWMLLLPKGDQSLPQRVKVLERKAMNAIFPDYVKSIKERAREVVSQMLAGRIEARSGPACRNCDYGGLCRHSAAILGDDA